jgi:hypothetical protein
MKARWLVGALLLLGPVARAEVPHAILVGKGPRDEVAHDQAVEAVLGEQVELFVLVERDHEWFGDVPRARIEDRTVPVRPWAELAAAAVEWSTVEPRMVHPAHGDEPPRPYTNAILGGRAHGHWQSYDDIEYFASVVEAVGGPRRVVEASHPSQASLDRHQGLGTLRWAARVHLPGGVVETPGAATLTPTGIDPRVLRVSYHGPSPDLLGWLAAYFNVPQVFGSAGGPRDHQTDRFVGADCADVVVGALRAAGHRDVRYTGVWGLTRYAPPVTPVLRLGTDGSVTRQDGGGPVRWGHDVEPRDLVILDYVDAPELPRAWDHVGVLADDDGDGVLDGDDLVWNMSLDRGLVSEPLRDQGEARLRLLRLRPRYRCS